MFFSFLFFCHIAKIIHSFLPCFKEKEKLDVLVVLWYGYFLLFLLSSKINLIGQRLWGEYCFQHGSVRLECFGTVCFNPLQPG